MKILKRILSALILIFGVIGLIIVMPFGFASWILTGKELIDEYFCWFLNLSERVEK